MMKNAPTVGEILERGEALYEGSLKEKLELEHTGEYAVIDVDTKKYSLHVDKIKAIECARKNFGHKTFFVVQVGNFRKAVNFRERKDAAWLF